MGQLNHILGAGDGCVSDGGAGDCTQDIDRLIWRCSVFNAKRRHTTPQSNAKRRRRLHFEAGNDRGRQLMTTTGQIDSRGHNRKAPARSDVFHDRRKIGTNSKGAPSIETRKKGVAQYLNAQNPSVATRPSQDESEGPMRAQTVRSCTDPFVPRDPNSPLSEGEGKGKKKLIQQRRLLSAACTLGFICGSHPPVLSSFFYFKCRTSGRGSGASFSIFPPYPSFSAAVPFICGVYTVSGNEKKRNLPPQRHPSTR